MQSAANSNAQACDWAHWSWRDCDRSEEHETAAANRENAAGD